MQDTLLLWEEGAQDYVGNLLKQEGIAQGEEENSSTGGGKSRVQEIVANPAGVGRSRLQEDVGNLLELEGVDYRKM
jgi:hypothetical protein